MWTPAWPCPAVAIAHQHRRGRGDPTFRVTPDGAVWRGLQTPEGPATLRLLSSVRSPSPADVASPTVEAHAWGAGAAWALAQVPELLGERDDVSGFEPRHELIVDLWRRFRHLRLGRNGQVFQSLLPTIIEQKVTGQEAFAGYRMLVQRFGETAPGLHAVELGLRVPPTAEVVAQVPSWEWLRMHIDPARSRTIVGAARVAPSLERLLSRPPEEADRALRSLPGIGEWTSAEVRQRAWGDADAVSFGDYHVAKNIGWALTGRAFDDVELARHLESWRPHRGRIQLLIAAARLGPPRHGARMAPRTHLPATVVPRGRPGGGHASNATRE